MDTGARERRLVHFSGPEVPAVEPSPEASQEPVSPGDRLRREADLIDALAKAEEANKDLLSRTIKQYMEDGEMQLHEAQGLAFQVDGMLAGMNSDLRVPPELRTIAGMLSLAQNAQNAGLISPDALGAVSLRYEAAPGGRSERRYARGAVRTGYDRERKMWYKEQHNGSAWETIEEKSIEQCRQEGLIAARERGWGPLASVPDAQVQSRAQELAQQPSQWAAYQRSHPSAAQGYGGIEGYVKQYGIWLANEYPENSNGYARTEKMNQFRRSCYRSRRAGAPMPSFEGEARPTSFVGYTPEQVDAVFDALRPPDQLYAGSRYIPISPEAAAKWRETVITVNVITPDGHTKPIKYRPGIAEQFDDARSLDHARDHGIVFDREYYTMRGYRFNERGRGMVKGVRIHFTKPGTYEINGVRYEVTETHILRRDQLRELKTLAQAMGGDSEIVKRTEQLQVGELNNGRDGITFALPTGGFESLSYVLDNEATEHFRKYSSQGNAYFDCARNPDAFYEAMKNILRGPRHVENETGVAMPPATHEVPAEEPEEALEPVPVVSDSPAEAPPSETRDNNVEYTVNPGDAPEKPDDADDLESAAASQGITQEPAGPETAAEPSVIPETSAEQAGDDLSESIQEAPVPERNWVLWDGLDDSIKTSVDAWGKGQSWNRIGPWERVRSASQYAITQENGETIIYISRETSEFAADQTPSDCIVLNEDGESQHVSLKTLSRGIQNINEGKFILGEPIPDMRIGYREYMSDIGQKIQRFQRMFDSGILHPGNFDFNFLAQEGATQQNIQVFLTVQGINDVTAHMEQIQKNAAKFIIKSCKNRSRHYIGTLNAEDQRSTIENTFIQAANGFLEKIVDLGIMQKVFDHMIDEIVELTADQYGKTHSYGEYRIQAVPGEKKHIRLVQEERT